LSFSPDIYFCHECKKDFTSSEELLFVEPATPIGFCGEQCIEKFYEPLVTYYDNKESQWRKEHQLEKEEVLDLVGKPFFMDELLSRPTEVYCFKNDFEQRFFSFIRELEDEKYGKFFMLATCFTIDHRPSFIIAATATCSPELAKQFRVGEKIENIGPFHKESKGEDEQVEIGEEILQLIELKKSQYLADLLEKRSPADIPFESFHLYDQFMESTMLDPDEIYSFKDREGDSIFTYIKAQDRDGISFFYFIVCMRVEKDWNQNVDALLPIITFPTLDGELYQEYKRGELVSGSLRN
jgi:hypothetical protein